MYKICKEKYAELNVLHCSKKNNSRDGKLPFTVLNHRSFCYKSVDVDECCGTAVLFNCVLVSGWSFVGTPIQCWFPAYFKGWWIQYSLDYCYVQNTYFLPFTKSVPLKNYWDLIRSPIDIPESVEKLAVCFWMPMAFWRALNMHSGISVKTVCDMTSIVEHVEPLSRRKNVDKIAQLLDHSTVLSARLHGRNLFTGRYILLFIFSEWTIRSGEPECFTIWYTVDIRELGNVHRHSVQCVLMINMFNEKIFLFFWWCWSYVISYLQDSDQWEMSESEFLLNIENFVKTCLQPDGMFLLRLIGTNSGEIVSKELRAVNLHANLKIIIRLKFIHLIRLWNNCNDCKTVRWSADPVLGSGSVYRSLGTLTNQIPVDYVERDSREIGYYQWVPFILALQAFLFYLPCLIWRLTNWYSGISVLGITNMAVDAGNMDHETRKKNVKTVAQHIRQSLNLQRELSTSGKLFGFLIYGKHYGIYVTGLYLFIKFLYILNVVCQFLILNRFLGAQYTFWGFEILRDLAYGREWQESGHFPRVTMCDFDVRVLGNLHRWTVQCVLMINMFNEKIYLFLWWWFFIISIFTFLNFFYWIFVSFNENMQVNFISRYLRVSDKISDTLPEQRRVGKFVRRELRPDGVFLLRIIASNAGDIIATELIKSLWTVYDAKQNHPTPPPVQSKKNMNYDKNDQSPYQEEKMPLAGSQ
ncbi:Innexin unc-9 [Trichinella spiralis]|uniref:Innexin n=1 Tax=Trichinella spiralis TaxID=6334 RepID=A0ABR3KA66_TRISP